MATTDGRVPMRLRIGVTGHRVLLDERAVADQVDDVFARLPTFFPPGISTPVLYEIVSPLGEGADRIVAERGLEVPGAILEVPLPLSADDYEQDFESPASRERFRALLARAERVWAVGGADRTDVVQRGPDRVDGYREAGAYVVDSCDLLIAVWDGMPPRGPGGTADMVDRAAHQAMPVFLIGADDPFDVQDPVVPVAPNLIPELEDFNDAPLPRVPAGSSATAPDEAPPSEEVERLEACLGWVEPHRRRAAGIAQRARRRFTWGSRGLFLLSAFAILAVTLSATTHDDAARRSFAYLEVALIAAALALWFLVRHGFHGRWIAARSLAERTRSAGFLAFAGERNGIGSMPEGDRCRRGEASQEWINRVCREIWRSRPRVDGEDRAVDEVQALLIDRWVSPQLAYYERRAKDHLLASRTLIVAGAVLFAGTLVAATLHAAELVHGTGADAVVVLSIVLPAFASALAGIAGLELHARHAARFQLMARRLGDLGERLGWETDLDRVRELARSVEIELRTEGEAWIDVMRSHDVEVPS